MYGDNFLTQNADQGALRRVRRTARRMGFRPRRHLAAALARATAAAESRRSCAVRSRPQPRSGDARNRKTLLAGIGEETMSRSTARAVDASLSYSNEPDLSVDAFIDVLRRSTLA